MLKKYKPFLRAGAIDTMAYRFNILIWAVITVCQVACMVFLWLAVYRSGEGGIDAEIHGFTFREMIAYVVLTTVFNFVTFNNDTLWNINTDIKKGTVGNYLIKPISYRGKFAATSLGSLLMMTLMFGLPLYTAALVTLGVLGFLPGLTFPTFFAHLGLFLSAGLCASLLNDTIAYIFGILCFYTASGWGLNSLKTTIISFLSGTLLPIAFFPAGLRDVVSWMPFAGMSQNPVLILMMKYDLAESLRCIAVSAAWIILLELFAKLLFSHAVRKVTVQGG
jgi:ABC-2 type transport system permease protein